MNHTVNFDVASRELNAAIDDTRAARKRFERLKQPARRAAALDHLNASLNVLWSAYRRWSAAAA
jgi:hypothetical protein